MKIVSKMDSGVVSDVRFLFQISNTLGITPYILPGFTLSYRCVLWGAALTVVLIANLALFLQSKTVVYDIDFVSQNLSLVGLTVYVILAIVCSIRARTKVEKIFRKLNKMDVQLKCVGLEVPSLGANINRRLVYLLLVLIMYQGPDFLIWLTGESQSFKKETLNNNFLEYQKS